MHVILAGGRGLIGNAVAAAFWNRGESVTILSRKGISADSAGGIRYAAWDGRTPGEWRRLFTGRYAVVNLAGESLGDGRWTAARKKRILASRLDSTGALVTAMREAPDKPLAFVNMSAVGYYGARWDDVTLTEEAPAGSGFLAEVCRRWEEASRPAAEAGIRTIRLRAGVVLDRNSGALRKMLPSFRLFAGSVTGSGRQWFPWIHARDIATVMVHIVDTSSLEGPVNCVAPGIVRMEDFCRSLGRVLHRPVWTRVPAVALRFALGEMSGMVTTGQRVASDKLARSGFRFEFPEITGALRSILSPA